MADSSTFLIMIVWGFFTREVPMPKSTDPLTPAQVYRFAVAFCQPHLAF